MIQHSSYRFWESIVLLVARLGLLFALVGGAHVQISNFHTLSAALAQKGFPSSNFFLGASIAIDLGACLLVALGFYTRFAAVILFLFLMVITFVFHMFWDDVGASYISNLRDFSLNMSVASGCLLLWITGPGGFSIDRLRKKKA
jgi:putative oxidoreductase